jgi:hypothetical protein
MNVPWWYWLIRDWRVRALVETRQWPPATPLGRNGVRTSLQMPPEARQHQTAIGATRTAQREQML